jgi:antitoxin (DNA-binding transcriptional repressor) of toxin-antitoxin stability system
LNYKTDKKTEILTRWSDQTRQPIIIGRAGEPIAILAPYSRSDEPRKLGGSWKGKVRISDDFDATDQEIIEAFYDSKLIPDEK